MAIKELLVKIAGDDSGLQAALDRTTKGLDEAGLKVDGVIGKFIGPAGLAIALGAVAKVAFDTAMEFERANEIIAKQTGATGKELQDLNRAFIEFNKAGSELSFEESAAGLSALSVRLGLTGDALVGAAGAVADFADVTDSKMSEAVVASSTIIQKWGLSAGDMESLLDKLYTASTETGISVDQLSSQLVTAGAQLQAMGLSLDSSIALLSGFEKAGVNTQPIMAGLSQAVRKFAEEGKPAEEAFSGLVKSIKDAKSPAEAYALAAEKMGRGSVEFVTAVRSGRFDIEKLTDVLKTSEGSVSRSAKASETWADKLAVLQNRAKAAAAQLAGLNSEASARAEVSRTINQDFIDSLETQGDVYAVAKKITEQYGISVEELQKIVNESYEISKNEGAIAEAAKLTSENYKKQLDTQEKLKLRGMSQYQYLQMIKEEEALLKEKARVDAEREAQRKAAFDAEIKSYIDKTAKVQSYIKEGLIPESDGIKEINKLRQEEIDKLIQKGLSGDILSKAEKQRILDLQGLIATSTDKLEYSENRKKEAIAGTTSTMVIGLGKLEAALGGTTGTLNLQSDALGFYTTKTTEASNEITHTADDLARYAKAINDAETAYKGLDKSGLESLKALRDELKKQEEAAKLTNTAVSNIGTSLLNIGSQSIMEGLKKVGDAFAQGGDAGAAMVNSLADLKNKIIDALPNLLLQAGLMLLPNPATLPIGLGLIAASGIIALAGPAIKQGIDNISTAAPPTSATPQQQEIYSNRDFDRFASGTDYAPGGVAWVGEQGPERMYVPQGAKIIPAYEKNTNTGGNTFVFNSPKTLDVGEAKRVFLSQQRKMAFEGGF